MDAHDAMEIARAALMLTVTLVGPLLMTSLIVGAAIGLIQALTQVQEMTLTFVPKIMAMGVVLLLCLPMIGRSLSAFTAAMADRIIHG